MVAFQGMVRIEKKTKIRQLTAVVKGLRIYNWDCGRGGAGILTHIYPHYMSFGWKPTQVWITFPVSSILRQRPQALT